MIYAAPGKIVLWGEYAVLAGAPAAVVAVNRYARVSLEPLQRSWRFSSEGFLTPGIHNFTGQFSAAPSARMAETILQAWGKVGLAHGFQLQTDSRSFFHQPGDTSAPAGKYGIGSSAAVCTASYRALADIFDRQTTLAEAITIHRQFQGGKGSGLDVAASWQGGYITFQDGQADSLAWPANLHWRAVWTGASSATGTAITQFDQWRQNADTQPLTALADACQTLCTSPDINSLAQYCELLRELDDAASLNIFTPAHRRLATIAAGNQLIYKPCGAGGGDIGIAIGQDPAALTRFCEQAEQNQFVSLNLETAPHGVKAG